MSREEAMKALIESGIELRRDDIELGKKLERERIIQLLERNSSHYGCDWACIKECDAPTFVQLIGLIKGEQK